MERRIAILIADGFTDSGLSIAIDVFRTANVLAKQLGKLAPFRIDVISPRGGPVRAASGLELRATRSAVSASKSDVLIVPGLWVESAAEMDALLERDDIKRLMRTVAAAHARGAIVASSCGGAFILADAGVLDGRTCTTTWWLGPHLKQRHPGVTVDTERALVVDGRVLTAGAVFAQADLALHFVGRFAGPKAAQRCAQLLLLDRHPSQAPYMAIHQLCANDVTVQRAEVWVRRHLAEDFDIGELASDLGVSQRTLARRLSSAVGVSPIGFVQRLRVETAVHLLETTRLSLQEVSSRVGYEDPNALRRLIQRETNASPRELRKRSAMSGRDSREHE